MVVRTGNHFHLAKLLQLPVDRDCLPNQLSLYLDQPASSLDRKVFLLTEIGAQLLVLLVPERIKPGKIQPRRQIGKLLIAKLTDHRLQRVLAIQQALSLVVQLEVVGMWLDLTLDICLKR